jgi:hypothetical protein
MGAAATKIVRARKPRSRERGLRFSGGDYTKYLALAAVSAAAVTTTATVRAAAVTATRMSGAGMPAAARTAGACMRRGSARLTAAVAAEATGARRA